MVIVSTVVLVNNARFGGVIKLENFAYDVALSIRQAQLYGISVARFQGGFAAGYGIQVNLSSSATSYHMFADFSTKNQMYDGCPTPGSPTCELVQTSTMSGNYRIKKVCVTPSMGAEVCSDSGGSSILNIYFIRPEPNAWISTGTASCNPVNGAGCQRKARIQLLSPKGQTMDVVVEFTGQISVQRVAG